MATLNDLTDGYNAVSVALLDGAGASAATTFKSLGSWRDEDIPRFIDELSPQLIGFKQKAAQAAIAYNGQVAALEGKPFVQPSLAEIDLSTEALRNGTNVEDVYRRPFVQMRMALAKNPGDFTAALNTGTLTARSLARTEVQLSRRKVSLFARKYNKNVVGYLRTLTGMESCALCYVASSQRYHKGDLLPIHPGCDCGEMPIYGDSDPGQIIDKQLLEKSHEAVGERFGSIARTARGDGEKLPDYNKIMVEDHGEMGPMLSVKGQAFTGPNDLSLKGKSMPVVKAPEPTRSEVAQKIRKKAELIDGPVLASTAKQEFIDAAKTVKYRGKDVVIAGPKTAKALDDVLDVGKSADAEIQKRVAERVKTLGNPTLAKKAQKKLDELTEVEARATAEHDGYIAKKEAEAEAKLRATNPNAGPFDVLTVRQNARYDTLNSKEYQAVYERYQTARGMRILAEKELAKYTVSDLEVVRIRVEETVSLLKEVRDVGQGSLDNKFTFAASQNRYADMAKEHFNYALEMYPSSWISTAAERFGGKLKTGFVSRGYFNRYKSEIMLSGGKESPDIGVSATATASHELGHMMEYSVPGIQALEWAYYHRRAAGDYKIWGSGRERGMSDTWADGIRGSYREIGATRYQGRSYSYDTSPTTTGPTDPYEIFTTGIESTVNDSRFFNYSDGSVDVEFRQFVLGVLFGL